MGVPEQVREQLAAWCAELVPAGERDRRRIGYTTAGDVVTILDRRPPAFPELGAAWASTALAQLRADDPEAGSWTLYIPAAPGSRGRWERVRPPAADPFELLDRIADSIRAVGSG
ncbi:hypothetical protein Ae168Ps1_3354 [Pseudonocardia sp. Ae168_Ps1]|uniref:DUF3024 domain-containing protein n=1 Tax=unclassified Pseudonocardia TaxID=2619320 RepID=UPI0001FFE3DD|nr:MULTISPECIES: hypothetical protein [unclassified Pseudonocardia]OLL74957.1 hypothetical protein Ae150APs1_3335 [Pseudonocardia sp. Ae150A_Ps1]OLL80948.1 hypothetical protein Ae168Ps1_3354 [Pseudonocardia sp. Ae168_Ps1]OLL84934.1 hypothetical protein Ae263Ps1_1989c [Pseudonocardia sp. Ae263_Ps1]OLL95049.1 hypothetical protein Ae356Ps1_4946 [Pseudonocardia sp. Ae356_Ps1]OLM21426.1 hypothetical protein Ae707Ps1_5685 [Pseudonocardia sp. Ae707_Ps1]